MLYAFYFSGRARNVILLAQPGIDTDGYLMHIPSYGSTVLMYKQHLSVVHVNGKGLVGIDLNT